ncbi:MAG: tryptophan synthase subunit alpha [Myxococcales bacterium]|nr:tryptophan synthase subunit alpha [Myxococcales bacterium]
MRRLVDAFPAGAKRKRLVTYLCVGDPDVDESVELALACVDAGADVLELGCPFSDPTADGDTIARASQRAIAAGGGLTATLRACEAIRKRTEAPVVLFGYYNPIFVRGEAAFAASAASAGADASLVVDLPVSAAADYRRAATGAGIGVIPLVAPTSTDEHVRAIAEHAASSPFVYYVAVAGVTGGSSALASLDSAADAAVSVRERSGRPTVVGFGIDSGERAARVAARGADGVVVGSAIVRAIEEGKTSDARRRGVTALVGSLRDALERAAS